MKKLQRSICILLALSFLMFGTTFAETFEDDIGPQEPFSSSYENPGTDNSSFAETFENGIEPQEPFSGGYEDPEINSSFFIQALPCPADIMEYASENALCFIRTLDETHSLDHETITVGQPFTYGGRSSVEGTSHLFIFPVFSEGEVVYTVRVARDPDGKVIGAGSNFLVDALNAYRNRTSRDCPLIFEVADNTLYARLGDTIQEVDTFWDPVVPDRYGPDRAAAGLETLDITEPIEFQDAR